MLATAVPTFYCPSKRAALPYAWINRSNYNFDPPELAGKTDYAANLGDVNSLDSDIGPRSLEHYDAHRWKHSGADFVAATMLRVGSPGHSGVIFQRSEIKFKDITDGTSKTYLIGEKNLNSNQYETCLVGNDDQSMYNGHDRDNLRSTYINLVRLERGILADSWLPQPDTPDIEYRWSFGGPHPGVWLAVFCDGSVRNLPYELDPRTHMSLGNRLDGNAVEEF
jgi:hypothetical protein